MFLWFTNWFSHTIPLFSEEDALFNPKERMIYRYLSGKDSKGKKTYILADPMSLYKRLLGKGPELGVIIKIMGSMHPDAPKAHEDFLTKVRDVFSVKPFEQNGLTEVETVELFDHFLVFAERLKKKGKHPPTSPEETSPPTPPSLPPSPSAASPTPNTSASGSAANEPPIKQPSPLPTEPGLPSVP